VLFGALHFSQGWIGMLQIVGLAVVLGTCFVLTRSLLAVIVAHFVFDFVQLQLVRVLEDLPGLEDLLPGN
jgi:membrane protease YdiL (CAAX protease family)